MNLIKWYKGKPYWLRGGIILSLLIIILFLIEGTFIAVINGGECKGYCPSGGGPCEFTLWRCFNQAVFYGIMIFPAMQILFYIPAKLYISQNLLNNLINIRILFYGVAILSYFSIGALIGWIYGKIKKDKK